jgi:hypothetical protein
MAPRILTPLFRSHFVAIRYDLLICLGCCFLEFFATYSPISNWIP